jgi:hypothetical protein
LPKDLVEYKLFGGKKDIHYGHYDLVGGRLVCTHLWSKKAWVVFFTIQIFMHVVLQHCSLISSFFWQAKDEVHTYIVDFLVRHDGMQDPPA